jgi:nucleoside-diphosphate kinase
MARERTYIMVKPDGVQRNLVGEIIKRFEAKGFKLVALKLVAPGREHLEKHYADLAGKGFFNGLINYMVRFLEVLYSMSIAWTLIMFYTL